jgi:peptidylprolyl isomerase
MKLTSALLFFAATTPLAAQTAPAKPAASTTAKPAGTAASRPAVRPAASLCVKLPELSPKIPALAADAPCAKHLYTITTVPAVKLENVSPLESATLKEDLGIESSSFSLDYIDTKIGTGEVAGAHKYYSIHYTGYLLDGTKFDSSLDRGEPIPVLYGSHQVIPGWDTGFAGMKVGGKRRLIIPYQLAYGATAHGPIPAKSTLVFDVELLGISDTAPAPKPKPAPPAPAAQPETPPAGAPPAATATPTPAGTPPPTSPKP